jgi:predicted dinucleotide-binding enzyme
MKIAILGTGIVGRTLATGLSQAGHDVLMGTRDVAETLARTEGDAMGNPPFGEWQREHAEVQLVPFAEAASTGEVVINATSGTGSLDALAAAGPGLDDKVLVDVANPLDFSHGMPPTLSVANTDSLAEQIQQRFQGAKVVKALTP